MDRHDEIFRRLEALGWRREGHWMAKTSEPYELFVPPSNLFSLAYFYDHPGQWSLVLADGRLSYPTEAQVLSLIGKWEQKNKAGKQDAEAQHGV